MSREWHFHGVERRESAIHDAAPPLVAVAHGSRDPRSAQAIRGLVDVVRSAGVDARVAFLDLSAPSLPEVLAAVHADGHRRAAVVPLLLGSAFHARVDLPALVAEVRRDLPLLDVVVSGVLGPDDLVQAAAWDRLNEAGATAEHGVVLAGVGSAHAAANATVARVAARWEAAGRYAAVTHAFATCDPDVPAAIARLRAKGAERIAVAPWFLAPGLLLDRVAAQARRVDPDVLIAAPLADHPSIAELVLARYATATQAVAAA